MRAVSHTIKQREYIGFVRRKPLVLALGGALALILYVGLPALFRTTYRAPLEAAPFLAAAEEEPPVAHLPTPRPLRAIYMTSCAVGSPAFRARLVALLEATELNALVIDVKDYSGTLSFTPNDEALKKFVSPRCAAPDMKEFIKNLHDKGIYVIGRITVFQDPLLAKRRPDLAIKTRSGGVWKDYKGLSYLDPSLREVWDRAVLIGREAYAVGFDELNFDYIRFPSDGPMDDIALASSGGRGKQDVLEDFFAYLSSRLKPTGAVLSADLFGMTTTNTDDLNIGQVLEKTAPYFDYVAPMVYPSHYPPRFNGWDNPNHYPYEVVRFSLDSAVRRLLATTTVIAVRGAEALASTTPPACAAEPCAAGRPLYPKSAEPKGKLRPWLQDFDYGGVYGAREVKAQIQAVYDAGLESWMLWDPANRYTRGAFAPKEGREARAGGAPVPTPP